MPIVYKNHPLSDEIVQVIARGLRERLDEYEYDRVIKAKSGIAKQPSAREADLWLLRLYLNKLVNKDNKPYNKAELLSLVAALPVTVGSVPVAAGELGGWLGLFFTARKGVDLDSGEEIAVPIEVVRRGPGVPWRLYDEVAEELDGEDPLENGWLPKENGADGAGIISCPGWSEYKVVSKGAEIVRVEVVKHHSCTTRRVSKDGKVLPLFASEAWHAWRCPSCKGAMDKHHGKAKSKVSKASGRDVLRGKIRLID
jgi:hypothetical protein